MPLHPSIPFIDNELGRSVIYEEYKGDFAQARQIAEAALNEARQQKNRAALADALLARGIVHLLQGEPPLALKCFQELEHAFPSDYNRRLRAVNFENLATYCQYNLFPDGNGAGGIELMLRWDGVEYAKMEAPRRETIFAQAKDTSARFESALVRDLLCNLLPARSFIENSRSSASTSMTDQLLQAAIQGPTNFRQTAQTYDADPPLLAFADLASADLCKRAQKSQPGWEFLKRALGIYEENRDAGGIGACHLMRGDWLAAPFSTPLAWNLSIKEGISSGSDLAWTIEADEFGQVNADLDGATSVYHEAEQCFREAKAPRGLAHIQLRYGYLAILNADWAAVIDHVAKAQQGFESCGDRLGYWLAQTHRILSRIGAGHYPEDGQTAEAIGTWGADRGSFSFALGLGILMSRAGRHWLIRKGDHERALACYRLAERLFKSLGAVSNRIKSMVDQGNVCRALGERDTALSFYEQALDLFKHDSEIRPAAASSILPHSILLANEVYQLYQDKMDADGMQRCAERLEKFNSQLSSGVGGAGGLAQLIGDALSGKGTNLGISALQTFALGNLIRATTQQARVLVPLYRARKAQDEGNPSEAQGLFAEALSAARATDDAQRDFLEATVFGYQKDYPKAVKAFSRYLDRGGADAGFTGQLASLMKSLAGEKGQLEAQRQHQRTLEQAFTFMVRVKAFKDAKRYHDELVGLAGEKWWQSDVQPWLSLSDCAEMHAGLGYPEKALEYFRLGIKEFESRRNQLSRDEFKTALASGSGPQYLWFHAARSAVALAQKPENTLQAKEFAGEAFNYIEKGKARALLDLMAGSAAVAGSARAEGEAMRAWRECNAQLTLWRGLLAQERTRQEPDKGRIAELDDRIQAQQGALSRLENQLAESDPKFYEVLNVQASVMSAEEVCAHLEKDTALIEYAFLGDDLLAWGLSQTGILKLHREALDAKALARDIRKFHQVCKDRQEVDILGATLSQILLSPLADIIRKHRHLIFVPYGPAHALPFHALPFEGEPLGVSRVISYLPSASTLQFVKPELSSKTRDRILSIGNPTAMAHRNPLTGEKFPARALPAAAAEAAFTAALFPQGKALIGGQATEQEVRRLLPDYPLIHFATHGVLSEENPLLSSILLADGEALSVYELMGMQLSADLVVLSACQTGLGRITGGDDVIGLTRGLLAAGARSTVVSLWPVDDLSTSLFMGEFYRRLRAGGRSADCLQAAQNYIRSLDAEAIAAESARLREAGFARHLMSAQAATPTQDYRHPYFWAPFVLVG